MRWMGLPCQLMQSRTRSQSASSLKMCGGWTGHCVNSSLAQPSIGRGAETDSLFRMAPKARPKGQRWQSKQQLSFNDERAGLDFLRGMYEPALMRSDTSWLISPKRDSVCLFYVKQSRSKMPGSSVDNASAGYSATLGMLGLFSLAIFDSCRSVTNSSDQRKRITHKWARAAAEQIITRCSAFNSRARRSDNAVYS